LLNDDPETGGAAAGAGLTYPVVDTGQTTCYGEDGSTIACGSAFTGQDAEVDGAQPSYVDNGDGTVTDTVTGLMWQQGYSGKMTWEEALTGAETFELAGYDDWRLPTIKELYSLIDFSGIDPSGWSGTDVSALVPFIDTAYFDFAYGDTNAGERIIDAQYWSSTEYVASAGSARPMTFGVNFADGRIKGYWRSNPRGGEMTQYVRYVRGNPDYGTNNFVDNGDGTITDQATGLMWMQDDSGQGMVWSDALTYCENVEAGGYDDWRLPNAKELQSIVDYTRSPDTTNSAAIDPLFNVTAITDEGGGTNYPFAWSSTTHANWTRYPGGNAAYVAFGEALGWMQTPSGDTTLMDVHGAGAQRSDPKTGDPADYPYGNGPQGDVVRITNYVRCVRDVDASEVVADLTETVYLPLASRYAEEERNGAAAVNLVAPLNETTTYLMDAEGAVIETWEGTYRPGNAVYLLDNGNVLRTGNTGSRHFDNVGGAGGIVEEITPQNEVVWSFSYDTTDGRLHHDVELLPNGNLLMLAWEYKTEAEALAAGRDPSLLSDGELWPDTVIEVDPSTNAIVWTWRVWDHLVQDVDPQAATYGVVADHPELIDLNYSGPGAPPGGADWTHINAIDYNADYDQILLSVRNFSEIWIIDHSTTTAEAAGHTGGKSGMGGDLLYRWGNPQAYDAGDASDQQLFVQHDAQWLPDDVTGAGNILIFNNGLERAGRGYSSVDELVMPVDGAGHYAQPDAGGAYGPASPVWTYTAATPSDFYAANISGAQRLDNGNTLICDGPGGHAFEVTPEGETVWSHDYGGPLFRVLRYAVDTSGDSASTSPWNIFPAADVLTLVTT
jgi:hypothetical protein